MFFKSLLVAITLLMKSLMAGDAEIDCGCNSRSCFNKKHLSQGMFCAEIPSEKTSKAVNAGKRRKKKRKFDPDLFLIKGSSSLSVSSGSSTKSTAQNSYFLEGKQETMVSNVVSSAPANKENLSLNLSHTLLPTSLKEEPPAVETKNVVFKAEEKPSAKVEIAPDQTDSAFYAGSNLAELPNLMEDHLKDDEKEDAIFSEQASAKDGLGTEELTQQKEDEKGDAIFSEQVPAEAVLGTEGEEFPQQQLILKSLKKQKSEDSEKEYETDEAEEFEDEDEEEQDDGGTEAAGKEGQSRKKKAGRNSFIKTRKPLSSAAIAS
ncbi:MAG: hypothetical protein ACK4V2_05660 [Pseudomonadota bacterium]|jgi:hypothetical protein|nr:hypothetical protein [Alphaproteobacteria bacterium]